MNRLMTMIGAAASLAVASVACSATANAGAVLDKVLATKRLTVAVGTDWGPLAHLNEQHELDGYDVEVARGIAKHLGVEVKFVTPGWDIIASANWQGRWDMAMGAMTPSKARAEKLSFPAMYFYERAVAVVHKDSKATKLSDLDGKVVGITAGNTQVQYANQTLTPNWVDAKPIEYKFKPGEVKTYDGTSPFDDLRLGDGVRIDAVLADETLTLNAIKSGYPLKVLGDPLYAAPGAISIQPGDKEFSEKIAAAIQSMRDDGSLSKLSMKWYDGVDYSVEQ
ncbi:MAG: transporter substrate-binding domain-containing protein [Mesorhizobium sp.]|uniref:transporter substrate-binding domain-containing protein n=1 Tax=Mesorhizobium sp. TaxID=1871066 RepID=UPI000FE66ACE|nr:transporter substrate-binding domain-containing protein [Mesorhizobium sp.]RWB36196.1 MAG: transporter substrate-binding domain-containing protein [Mesorhizobium sp.]RWC40719.1 MAG: transporter substrate-binding domain-containing protein [Mesorhizobium sp.]RWF76649.1 MAG: transporter substrate-binding domain-containing protein [Mesorhizobium sp.]TIX86277.1 MAG: transporter substrate-binding domain-containing protein [Mesorhizobium sp.]